MSATPACSESTTDDDNPSVWIAWCEKFGNVNNSSSINHNDFLPEELPTFFRVLFAIIYVVIIVVALVGNFLVMAVIGLVRKMRTVTNVLLVSLAGSDALIAALNMPFQLLFHLQNEWTMGEAMCKFTNYVQGVVVVTSILTLTGIAIDRFYAICRPLQARHLRTLNRAGFLIASFWISALILLIPQLIIQRLEPFIVVDLHRAEVHSVRLGHMCVEYFWDFRLNVAYTLFFYLVLYVVPVGIMFVAYGRIALTLWRRSPLAETAFDVNRRLTEKKRVVRMLVIIVSIFTVSWFPFFTAQVYMLANAGNDRKYQLRVVFAIFQLLAYSNCCINPIVYCLLNDSFRQRLKKVVLGACPKMSLRRLTASRRATLTETIRTTAAMAQSSTRRGSHPRPFSRSGADQEQKIAVQIKSERASVVYAIQVNGELCVSGSNPGDIPLQNHTTKDANDHNTTSEERSKHSPIISKTGFEEMLTMDTTPNDKPEVKSTLTTDRSNDLSLQSNKRSGQTQPIAASSEGISKGVSTNNTLRTADSSAQDEEILKMNDCLSGQNPPVSDLSSLERDIFQIIESSEFLQLDVENLNRQLKELEELTF